MPVTRHWRSLIAIIGVLLLTACSGGSQAVKKSASTTTTPTSSTGTPTTVPVYPTNLTPVSGAYSLYVDPTYGYSFQYPSTWLVQQGIGQGQSNVAFLEPIIDPQSPDFHIHPFTTLMIRATNDDSQVFVQELLCGVSLSSQYAVAGFPGANYTTYGSFTIDNEQAYGAPAFGVAFFANGMAYEIWLQDSSRFDIQAFFDYEKPNWDKVISTFKPGAKVKTLNPC